MDYKPIIYNAGTVDVESIKNQHSIIEILDHYHELLEDLFLIRNPQFRFNKNYKEPFNNFIEEHTHKQPLSKIGNWVYFPWNKLLVHFLPDDLHQELRTARNKNIITGAEQQKFYQSCIGIAGLSIGSHAALTISLMGGGKHLKMADPDVVSGSNLNRIRYDFTKVGLPKCSLATEQIYQMNPYADIETYFEGVTESNIDSFLNGTKKLDVLVEEMDSLEMKIRIRLEAKKYGIPVIMATDNGDNIIVDIERYDLDKNLEIFNGAAGHLTLEEFKSIPPQDMPKLATKIAGKEFIVPRMQKSLLEVGKTLYSWPQTGDAATLSGVAMAYVAKRIILGEKLKTGKLQINLDSIFDPDYNSPEAIEERRLTREHFLSTIGL